MSPKAAYRQPGVMLTARQRELVLAIAEGLSRTQAAVRLGISPLTVTGYTSTLALTLGTRRPQGVVGAVIRRGLLHPELCAPVVLSNTDWELVDLFADGNGACDIARLRNWNRQALNTRLSDLSQRLSASTPAHLVWRAAASGARARAR